MWQAVGIGTCAAVFWLHYTIAKDRRNPEPFGRVLWATGLGGVAALASAQIFEALDRQGAIPDLIRADLGERLWVCMAIIGPVEEGTKLLVAALFILRWPEFDEWRDGFVYAAALGIGFATVENLLHAPGLPLVEQVARSLTLPITHTLFSAVWGLGVARAIFGCEPVVKRVAWAVGSILLGMALHGFYDFLVFTPGNLAWSSGLVLGIWIVVLVRLRSRGGGLGPGSPR